MIEPSPSQRELFEHALTLDPAERSDYLAAHCAEPAARVAIERMIEFDAQADGEAQPLAHSFDELLARVGEADSDDPPPGACVGPFTLLDKLGEGGSSIVFRAERVQAGVVQRVALKLLRRALYTADEQRRFRDERRALAQLQHSGIARLVEGGISEAGIPYIALELVEGTSIVEHARARQLDLRARLRLFTSVCSAVEAAHRALIVHRDLKPSNVLVTPQGEVKLLDFGIAKLLDADIDVDGTHTQHAPMTPAYAAPEQFARGQITTATDVYALGVLLGELITGQRREPGDARTPSSQVGDTTASEASAPSVRLLRRKLRGDLDNIVLRATAVEPERRYASAGALGDDIDSYLDGRPVSAHPPSPWYRAAKFVRRHRGGVATSALFLLAILASLGLALWQANRAQAEAQRATSVRDFLLRVFSAAEPAGPRLAPPSVVDVVRASISEAQRSRALYPAVRIELLESLGSVLRAQGQVDESIRILEANYRDASATFGGTDGATLNAGLGLARALVDAGEYARARSQLEQLLHDAGRADADLRARLLATSAALAADRYEPERALRESLAALAQCDSSCSELVRIDALRTRAGVLASFQQDEAAIAIMQDALAAQRAYYGGPHVEIAETEQGLSRAYRRLGQFDRAQALAREALSTVEASVPDPHRRRTDALDTLRQVLIDTRQFDEAETLGLRIVATTAATQGPGHPDVATSENTLGFTYMLDAKYAQAIEHFRAALDLAERIPDNARKSAIYRANLGVSIGRNGDLPQGIALVRTAIEALRALAEPDYDQICSALEKLGALQRFSGDSRAAATTYAQSLEIYRERLPDAPKAWRVVSLVGLGHSLYELGDDAHAEAPLREALANETTPVDRISPDRIEARAALAGVMFRLGRQDEALMLIEQSRSEAAAAQGRLSPSLRAFVESVHATMAAPTRAR